MTRAFDDMGYEEFRRMATDESLSPHQRIGFPDAYREGFEQAIFDDICRKLPALQGEGKRILDVGPGCAGLPRMLIDLCERQGHSLVLVDSPEMLAQLPDRLCVNKLAGFYPDDSAGLDAWRGGFDAILCYSVFHYLFAEANVSRFLDRSIELLAPGGSMLVGDIPNISKRKRFFASPTGIRFHQQFTGSTEVPAVDFRAVEHGHIDDAVILGMIMRARAQGCDAYWLPQPAGLPMANRREDVLITKP